MRPLLSSSRCCFDRVKISKVVRNNCIPDLFYSRQCADIIYIIYTRIIYTRRNCTALENRLQTINIHYVDTIHLAIEIFDVGWIGLRKESIQPRDILLLTLLFLFHFNWLFDFVHSHSVLREWSAVDLFSHFLFIFSIELERLRGGRGVERERDRTLGLRWLW